MNPTSPERTLTTNLLQSQHRFSFPDVCSDLRTKVTYESYMRELHTVPDESYECIKIQESCIIIQSRTDPEGSAKVIRKVV